MSRYPLKLLSLCLSIHKGIVWVVSYLINTRYPGLWNICARTIQNEISRSCLQTFGIADWQELLISGKIQAALRIHPSIMRIIDSFLIDRTFGLEAKSMFLNFLLSSKDAITLDPVAPLTVFLANLGLIIPINLDFSTFTITSRILPTPPSCLPPYNNDGKLDVLSTLVEAVKYLNYDSLNNARTIFPTKQQKSTINRKSLKKQLIPSNW